MTDKYAIYIRYSHEEMRDSTTLDVQENKCREFITANGGECVAKYVDEAESATTVSNRLGYQKLLADAGKKKFTHLVVLRWERFHRDATEAATCKEFLRRVCKLTVLSVYEPSAHDGAVGAFVEGFLDHMNAFTSAQLSQKYKDAKYSIFKKGGYIAGTRLFGYNVGSKAENYVLKVNEDERAGVLLMFELYATGKYSYADVAKAMHEAGYTAVTGRKFTKHAVRTGLGNAVYKGRTSYQPAVYHDKEKKHRDYSAPVEVRDGVHEPIISRDLWDRVVQVRGQRDTIKHGGQVHTPFLLRGVIWCWHCFQNRSQVIGKEITTFGKCQCRAQKVKGHTYKQYKCVTREQQNYDCPSVPVRVEKIDTVVLELLNRLPNIIPQNWYDILTHEMAKSLEGRSVVDAIEELRDKKQRVLDMYEDGLIDRDALRLKTQTIENEIEAKLPMLEADSVQSAASLVQDFPKRFLTCGGDVDKQNELIRQIIDRVFVEDGQVVGVTFKANVHLMMKYGADIWGVDTNDYVWVEWSPNMYERATLEPVEKISGRRIVNIGKLPDIQQNQEEEELASKCPRRDLNSRPTV